MCLIFTLPSINIGFSCSCSSSSSSCCSSRNTVVVGVVVVVVVVVVLVVGEVVHGLMVPLYY